jgi:hypothetical protein
VVTRHTHVETGVFTCDGDTPSDARARFGKAHEVRRNRWTLWNPGSPAVPLPARTSAPHFGHA